MARAPAARKSTAASEPTVVIRLGSARRVFPSDAALADAIGVNRSQIRRWREGVTEPSPETADRLVGLDAVIELLTGYLEPSTIRKWLHGFDAHLGNRRPIDVLRQGGLSEVIAAVQALKSGSFA